MKIDSVFYLWSPLLVRAIIWQCRLFIFLLPLVRVSRAHFAYTDLTTTNIASGKLKFINTYCSMDDNCKYISVKLWTLHFTSFVACDGNNKDVTASQVFRDVQFSLFSSHNIRVSGLLKVSIHLSGQYRMARSPCAQLPLAGVHCIFWWFKYLFHSPSALIIIVSRYRKDICKFIAQQRPGRLTWKFRSLFTRPQCISNFYIFIFFHEHLFATRYLTIFTFKFSPCILIGSWNPYHGTHIFDLGCVKSLTLSNILVHITFSGELLWALQAAASANLLLATPSTYLTHSNTF